MTANINQNLAAGDAVREFFHMNDHSCTYRHVRLHGASPDDKSDEEDWSPENDRTDSRVLAQSYGQFADPYKPDPEPVHNMCWLVNREHVRRMDCLQVPDIVNVVSGIDIFASSTGNFNITTLDHTKKMKKNASGGNIGHFDNEIDMDGLESLEGTKVGNIKPQVGRSVFPDGPGVIVLASGRLPTRVRNFFLFKWKRGKASGRLKTNQTQERKNFASGQSSNGWTLLPPRTQSI